MNWKRIHFYLHTCCRYFLATMILSYAFAKILGTQFTIQPSTYDRPVGSLSGFELTWYYYGYSFWYCLFIAATQIASSLLLFFRKTTRLGIVLFLSFMINILLVDYTYNIEGAKGLATIMTIMALFVFFSEFPLFYKYFITEPSLFQEQERPEWIRKISPVKQVYIPLVFISFCILIYSLKNRYMGQNQFYGTWQNTDSTAVFSRLNFEAANSFKINGESGATNVADGTYTFTEEEIVLKTFTKDYQEILKNDHSNRILNPDTAKTIILIKGKYLLNESNLTIHADTGKMVFVKVIR